MAKTSQKNSPKNPMASRLDALIAGSRANAEKVEEGEFRLDWTRALDKIKRFQLTDPHRYVLELAQCAIAGGATRIDVETDADDVIIRYDAPWHGESELGRLFDYLFARKAELAALRQLALAVNSALALEPRFVQVDSGDGDKGHRLRLASHTELTVTPLAAEDMLRGTRVHVRDRLTWNVLIEFFRSRTAEGKHLAENAAFAPIPIYLDGDDLRRELAPDALATRDIRTRGMRGQVALMPAIRTSSELHICMNGIRVVTEVSDDWKRLGPVGFVGYVDNPALSRNASHSDVHRDAEYERTLSAVSAAVHGLLRSWLEDTLLRTGAAPGAELGEVERHYLALCARLFLRGGHAKKGKLAPELDALLDVPDMVDLAVSAGKRRTPKKSALRPVWEAYRKKNACQVAARIYDIRVEDLPDGMVPVLGPDWVINRVFHGTKAAVDDDLVLIEQGQKNRREREAMRRQAVLSASEAMIKVRVSDDAHAITGELGLDRPARLSLGRDQPARLSPALAEQVPEWLRNEHARHHAGQNTGQHEDQHRTRVLFLREGVPLGEQTLAADAALSVAVLDSPGFEPNLSWDDVVPGDATRAVQRMLAGALPELLRALHDSFGVLPPPRSLLEAGYFTADGVSELIPPGFAARWPGDSLAADARWHVDIILERHRKLGREDAPWLWQWPLFYTITGQAVSLAQILGEAPVSDPRGQGAGTPVTVKLSHWLHVLDAPWSEDAPERMWILNLSQSQKKLLQRYSAGRVQSGKAALGQYRTAALERRDLERRRRSNLAEAERSRQPPRLDPMRYLAVIDLPIADGAGQAGIPAQGWDPAWVLFLDGDLPLCKLEFQPPFPVHAVVSSARIEADEAFETVRSPEVAGELIAAVRGCLDQLMARFAASPEVHGGRGRELLWKYLDSVKPRSKNWLDGLPAGIADVPLMATVDRGRISLRQVRDDARVNLDFALTTSMTPGRQLSSRPILVCKDQEQRIVRRLLGIKLRDYTQGLRAELAALERMDLPRRPAELRQPVVLAMDVADESAEIELKGQIAIPRDSAALLSMLAGSAGGHAHDRVRWVDVLKDGVFIERRPLDIDNLPLVAVVDSPKFQPNQRWDALVPNKAWNAAEQVLRTAARALVLRACAEINEEGRRVAEHDAASLLECLRGLAGRRFQGKPELDLDRASELERALARARIWSSADVKEERVSLVEISERWQSEGVVWVVDDQRGHVAPGRLIVRGGDSARQPLAQIFGDRVRDGAKVLLRDDAAHRRKMAAPELGATLPVHAVMEAVAIAHEYPERGLVFRGEVGVAREYGAARPGIELHIGVEGRLLCTHTVEHALRGVARVDCRGLEPNRDWTGVADDRQLRHIEECVRAALWDALERAAASAGELSARSAADEHRRILFLEALAVLARTRSERKELGERLAAAPLFRTVRGQSLSAAELRAHVASEQRLLVVSDSSDRGEPQGGRLILHAGEIDRKALHALFAGALRRHDEAWKKELTGQRRRQQTPKSQPHLDGDVAVKLYVQEGSTTLLIGLLRPPAGKERLGDKADAASRIHVHIDQRKVIERQVMWHPTVEVWLDDDRLTPTTDYGDVHSDDAWRRALALAKAQIPELVARAAEAAMIEPSEALRLRLRAYALDRRIELQEQAEKEDGGAMDSPRGGASRSDASFRRGGPGARILASALWPCLTSAGAENLSTAQLLAAHAAGQLHTVDADVSAQATEPGVVAVRASAAVRTLLGELAGKKLGDYTARLGELEARRRFMRRPPVAAIDLRAAAMDEPVLWRHALTEPGWDGEIAIAAQSGQGMHIQVFHEHRPVTSLIVPSALHVLGAAQCASLAVSPGYDAVARDASFARFVHALERAVGSALVALVHHLDDLDADEQGRAAPIVLTALAVNMETRGRDPDRDRLIEVLAGAPVLPDASGQRWSVADVKSKHPRRGAVAAVSPRTARSGPSADDRLVLALDEELFACASRVLELYRHDSAYREGVALRRRMDKARTSYTMPGAVLAVAKVAAAGMKGEFGLLGVPGQGWLALFSHGRMVEEHEYPEFFGLVGYVDGALATDSKFERVMLDPEHHRAIARLYDERLAEVVALAAEHRGRKAGRWRALRAYVCCYLRRHLDDLGRALDQRRARVVSGEGLTDTLRKAVTTPIFEHNSGEWIDLATVVSGDPPVVVVMDRRRKRVPAGPGVLIIAGEAEVALLRAIVGSGAVLSYQQWCDELRQAKARETKARQRQQYLAEVHLLSALQSVLREAVSEQGTASLNLAAIAAMAVQARGSARLAESLDTRIAVNTDHEVWKRAAAASDREQQVLIWHLAAAVVTDLGLAGAALRAGGALNLLAALSRHAQIA